MIIWENLLICIGYEISMKILFVYSNVYCSCTRKNVFELKKGFESIGQKVNTEYYLKINEEHFEKYDVIMFHRLGGNGVNIKDWYVKKMTDLTDKYRGKVLVVYHIDDLLVNDTIYHFVNMADVFMVPNKNYVPHYESYNKNFSFINQTFMDIDYFNSIPEVPSQILPRDRVNLIWASTGLVGKNFMKELIPEIFKKFKSKVHLHIIGSGSNEFLKYSNVTVKNNLSYTDFIDYFRKSDICLNPISIDSSRFRGVKTKDFIDCKSELKYCTAGLARIPIISGRSYSYEKSITNRYNGIILDNNTDHWLDAVEELINNESLKKRIVDNSYKICMDKYSLSSVAKVVKKIFENNIKKFNISKKNNINKVVKSNNINSKKIGYGFRLDQYQYKGNSVLGEIFSKRKITQEFKVNANNLCKIELKAGTYQRINFGIWKFCIMEKLDDSTSIKRIAEVDINKIKDNEWFDINFEPLPDSRHKIYYLQIIGLDCHIGSSATLYYDSRENSLGGSLYINKNKFTGNLSMRTYCLAYNSSLEE